MADINFTDQDFSDQVLKSEMPVVVDFGSMVCALSDRNSYY